MKHGLMGAALFLLMGCGPELTPPSSEAASMVDADAWTVCTAQEDPFSDRPQNPECPSSGYAVEDGFFEIETDVCHYGTFVQPSKLAVGSEQKIRFNFWHSPLSNPEPAQAHVALQIGDQLLWEKTIPIPNDANVVDEQLQLKSSIDEGDPIYFHLHNHGNNAWRLGTIEIAAD